MWETVTRIISDNFGIAGILGAAYALYTWRISQRQKEVVFLHSMIKVIRDDEMYEFIRKLDYNVPWYGESFHNGPLELKVDKMLMELSYLCHLRKTRLISSTSFDFFLYDINAVLSNPQMVDYFYNLYQYTRAEKAQFPFVHLLNYAFEKGYMDRRVFDNSESWQDKKRGLHNYLSSETPKENEHA